MDSIIVNYLEEPKLKNPILIEGLPGVGNVGKLAAEHLIDELKAKKFAEIISKHFPPQVLVDDDGIVDLVKNELYYYRAKQNEKYDLILLVGDYQGLTAEGQYDISATILDIAEKFGVKQIVTLGGYGLGRLLDHPKVLGAATDKKYVEIMKKYDVLFSRGEPGSGIVGASGLLLGLGKARNIPGICLMGETSGYLSDPKSAQAVLQILINYLGIKIDFTKLEHKALQTDRITAQIKALEASITKEKREHLEYIG